MWFLTYDFWVLCMFALFQRPIIVRILIHLPLWLCNCNIVSARTLECVESEVYWVRLRWFLQSINMILEQKIHSEKKSKKTRFFSKKHWFFSQKKRFRPNSFFFEKSALRADFPKKVPKKKRGASRRFPQKNDYPFFGNFSLKKHWLPECFFRVYPLYTTFRAAPVLTVTSRKG
mgnify:CR=1 FL=1